ncbi:hypothetical protein [Escherichia coli]|uniref:hypothetical protein n=1 Tax=Escherichia coli TaxID=562 RepID=UPI0030C756A6|nr:hypothetical protein [Escherichia coli]
MRNLGTNTYLDLMAKRTPGIEGVDEKEAFSRLLRAEAEAIANKLPELVMPLIDERVEELFQAMPESMKKEDKVTHDKMDEKALRNMFAGIVANKIGLGFSTLRK